MNDVITQTEEQSLKTVLNNYSMSGSMKKLRYWSEELIVLVNKIVLNHTNRAKTKIVEKVVYIDKQKSEKAQRDLLSKIVRGK